MRNSLAACSMAAALMTMGPVPAAWSLGDAPVAVPGSAASAQQQTPDLQAKLLYNDGIDEVRRADNAAAAAATETDSASKTHDADDARTLYSVALRKFQQAVQLDPKLHEAWNYLGYTHRKLGDYDDALDAYEHALALRPNYPEAIEYRAEAYLALRRFADAERSYLDLFAANRAVASKLLDAMRSWIAAQRTVSAATDTAAIDDLDKWVKERTQIAAQTASLTRAGAAASWQ